ncbi:MAG: hypothetical protein CL933_24505 [Deltaproteobacteria bacterium]|nr:hypothetical protein [Deltaproteobacteria bacterium]
MRPIADPGEDRMGILSEGLDLDLERDDGFAGWPAASDFRSPSGLREGSDAVSLDGYEFSPTVRTGQ